MHGRKQAGPPRDRPRRQRVHGQGACLRLRLGGAGLRPAAPARARGARRLERGGRRQGGGAAGLCQERRRLARARGRPRRGRGRDHRAEHAAQADRARRARRRQARLLREAAGSDAVGFARDGGGGARFRARDDGRLPVPAEPDAAARPRDRRIRRDRRAGRLPRHPRRGLHDGSRGALQLPQRAGRRRRADGSRQPHRLARPLSGRPDRRSVRRNGDGAQEPPVAAGPQGRSRPTTTRSSSAASKSARSAALPRAG